MDSSSSMEDLDLSRDTPGVTFVTVTIHLVLTKPIHT